MSSTVRNRRTRSRSSADSPTPIAATVPAVEKSLSLAVQPAFLLVLLRIVAVFTFLSLLVLPDDRLQILVDVLFAFGNAIYTLLTDFGSGLVEMLTGVGSVFSVGTQQLLAAITFKNVSMMFLLAIVFTYFPDISKKFSQVLEKSLTKAVPLSDE